MTTPLVVTKRMTEFPADTHTIDRYEATGGYEQARRATGMTRDELVEEIKTSGLLGRGGAAFSAGLKWSFLAKDRPSYLVVNADESEPGTFKDRQLLERDPHQLLEGIIITAIANEVHQAFIYIRGEYPKPARRVQAAIGRRTQKSIWARASLAPTTSWTSRCTWALGVHLWSRDRAHQQPRGLARRAAAEPRISRSKGL